MCFPLAIPLALMAAGSVAKAIGNGQAQHAQMRTFNAEQARQKGLTNQQQQSFEDSLHGASAIYDPAAMAKAADSRNTALQATVAPVSEASYLPGASSAPSVVHTAADTAASGTHAQASALAAALAKLGGVNDQILGANIDSAHNAQRIGQLGSFKAGSSAVLPAELNAAANKGSFLRGVGGLAQQIGQAMAGAQTGGIGGSPGISSSILKAPFPLAALKPNPASLLQPLGFLSAGGPY